MEFVPIDWVNDADCAGPRGRLSALSVSLGKSVLHGGFVWARRALKAL